MTANSSKADFASYLNVKNAQMPVFSADGSRLLYLSDITGTWQVWSVAVEGGWPDQLTFFDERVNLIKAAPNGSGFIITRDQGGNEQDQLYFLKGNAAEGIEITALSDEPRIKHNFGAWEPDGGAITFSSNRRDPAHFDVYIQRTEANSQPELIYQLDGTLYPRDWSPDGRYLIVTQAFTNINTDLYLVDLEKPGSAAKLLTAHENSASFQGATFAPDGKRIYFTSDLNRDFFGLAYLELDSLEIKFLATPEWDIESFELSPDGAQLAYAINENGYSRLTIHEIANGNEKIVEDLPRGVIIQMNWSKQGDKLAFDFHSPVRSMDIWVYEVAAGKLRQVTRSPRGGLNPQKFVEAELIHYPTFDGLQIPALWFLPKAAKPDGKTPVVVYVHGGPEGQTLFGWNSIFQYLVARGYAVLAPNVRGSSGYGKHYQSLDDIHKRMDSVADLKSAVEWLKAGGYADASKIAVWGGSYGGFMVLSAITTYPELWAAGVDIVGIANLVTLLENTSSYRRHLRESEYGYLDRDREFLAEISPIYKADRITAPLIVLHGVQDPRVPIGEAKQIVASLTARQHPVESLYFEDEGHGITKLKNRLVAYPAIANFLDKHLFKAE